MTTPTLPERVRALQVHSSYVETCLKHALIAALASVAWQRRPSESLQVFNSEVDDSGFDVVIGLGPHVRHIQLKQAHSAKTPAKCSVRTAFAPRPGACVVLIAHHIETLALESFRFFGGAPSEPMPAISGYRKSYAPGRRNATGHRKVRENYRDVRVRKLFSGPHSITELFDILFHGHVA
jgi:hypothetical protein